VRHAALGRMPVGAEPGRDAESHRRGRKIVWAGVAGGRSVDPGIRRGDSLSSTMLGFRLKIKSLAGETPKGGRSPWTWVRPIRAVLPRDAARWGLVPKGRDLLFSRT